jgi:hypothetical protein
MKYKRCPKCGRFGMVCQGVHKGFPTWKCYWIDCSFVEDAEVVLENLRIAGMYF